MARRTFDPTKHCGATNRQGEPCTRPLGAGTPHSGTGRCSSHGGSTPAHVLKAQREETEQVARRYLDNPDSEPMTDPGASLLRLASRVEAAVNAVGVRVNQLTEISVVTAAGGEQIKAEVAVWDKLLGRLHGILVDIERLGVEKRLAGVTERNSEVFGQLLRAILDDLALSGEQAARVPEVVGRHLRALSA